MSAPETNLKKQRKRHWGPLVGIALMLAVVAALVMTMIAGPTDDAPTDAVSSPEGSALPAQGGAETSTNDSTSPPQVIESGPRPDTVPAD